MQPAATNLCLLTGVTGGLRGAGERVSLYIDTGAPGGPQWTLNGTSGQGQLKVTATCVSYAAFATSPVISKSLTAHVYGTQHSTGCDAHFLPLGDKSPEAAPFLAQLSGRFSGAAEEARVETGLFNVTVLSVKACSDGGIEAGAMGVLSPLGPIKYRTLSDRSPDQKAATVASTYKGPKSKPWYDASGDDLSIGYDDSWVLPANEAVCGLVAVGGKFQGYGERVELARETRNGRPWWKLIVGSQAEDAQTSGAVRCLARDQR